MWLIFAALAIFVAFQLVALLTAQIFVPGGAKSLIGWVRTHFPAWWRWALPRLTNPASYSAMLITGLDLFQTLATDPATQDFLSKHPLLHFAAIAAWALATRQRGAPHVMPSGPAMGPGAMLGQA